MRSFCRGILPFGSTLRACLVLPEGSDDDDDDGGGKSHDTGIYTMYAHVHIEETTNR